jgi:hypothetical protein
MPPRSLQDALDFKKKLRFFETLESSSCFWDPRLFRYLLEKTQKITSTTTVQVKSNSIFFADHGSSQVTKKKERKKVRNTHKTHALAFSERESRICLQLKFTKTHHSIVLSLALEFKRVGPWDSFRSLLCFACLLFFCLSYDRGRGPQCFEALLLFFFPFHKFRYDEHKKKKKNKKKKPCFLAKTSL